MTFCCRSVRGRVTFDDMSPASSYSRIPGNLGKSVRWYQIGKKTLDRRSWLKYLRWQAVARALKGDQGLISEKVGQAATAFCDVLERTDLPIDQDGSGVRRLSKWTREKITWGIRFPDYRGRLSETFDDRVRVWVKEAAASAAGRRGLEFAGYDIEEEGAEKKFAESVLAEIHALLIEAREGEAPGAVRWEMAAEINRHIPDSEVRLRHDRMRKAARAVSAGGSAAITTQVFTDDWTKAFTLGVVLTALTAIVELTISAKLLSVAQIAGREQVRAWLEEVLVARLWPNLRWADGIGERIELSGRTVSIGDLIIALAKGMVHIDPLNDDSKVFVDLNRLMDHSMNSGDHELMSFLIRLETALRFKPNSLPHAFRALITSVRERNLLDEAPGSFRPPLGG